MSKENVILADCSEEEVLSFAEGLEEKFIIKSHISNWRRTGKISELKRYATYFYVGFQYFLHRKRYDTIIGWQQFYALILCFFCELFHVKKENIIVALNFTYKRKSGKVGRLYRWFMGKCISLKHLDYIHVPSYDYAVLVSREFGFPQERIIVTHFGINDPYELFRSMEAPNGFKKNGYALSIGRSNRDFDFLIRAWRAVDYPLVIISDTYVEEVDEPNVTFLKNIAGKDSFPWIANCSLMIIPIDDGTVCSGDTVLLTAMAVKRKLLVTKPSTLAEMYILDGENALLSEKEEIKFCAKVNELLYSGKYINLGEQARDCFLQNFSRKSMGKKVAEYIH